MLKETSLCMGCMNEKGEDPCKLCGYSDLDPHIPTYLEPKTFLNERYIVGRLLSYNGEGAVYIGYDTVTSTKVTIKEFMPDTLCTRQKGETNISVNANNSPLYKTYMSEFADLNRSLIKLRGMAHIQAVLDVFYANNTCYAVFEFISGISLKTYLANAAGEMTWEQVKELFPPIFTTLSLAHAAGIIHRGISPQTIFVTDKMELKLSCFAITAARTTGTEIACEIYSGYAAPEQYTNEPNGTWTDVYGISAVLYKVLTGTNPTEAIARTGGMPEPSLININVPQHVSKVIMSGMKLSNDTRIRTVTELVDKLFAPPSYSAAGGAHTAQGRPVSGKEARRLQKQRKERIKFLTILAAVGMILVAFAIVFALTLNGSCAPSTPQEVDSNSGGGSQQGNTSTSSYPSGGSAPVSGTNSGDTPPVESIIVPNFTDNYRYENAVKDFEGSFTLVPTYDYNDEFAAGFIFEQSIEPDTTVPKGTEIKVSVSKGRSAVELPPYGMQMADDYAAELTRLNIKYQLKDEDSNDLPEGNVLRCTKQNGDEIAVGDLVNVADGETVIVCVAKNYEVRETVIVPNLTDTWRYETAAEFFKDQFTLVPEYEYSSKYMAGYIFEQSVDADTEIDKGAEVRVKVSLGSGIAALPSYDGKKLSEYITELTNLGIKYILIEEANPALDDGYISRCAKGMINIAAGDPVSIKDNEIVTVFSVRN